MSSIYDVQQFHNKFKIPRLSRPGFLPEDDMRMRLNFQLEELLETAGACGFQLAVDGQGDVCLEPMGDPKEVNLAEAFDGLLDQVYVALGTADRMGLGGMVDYPGANTSIWWEGWRRVQRANMAKVLVENAADSKRGSRFDLKKPKGWRPPEFGDLLGVTRA